MKGFEFSDIGKFFLQQKKEMKMIIRRQAVERLIREAVGYKFSGGVTPIIVYTEDNTPPSLRRRTEKKSSRNEIIVGKEWVRQIILIQIKNDLEIFLNNTEN